jgi:O-antigen/teichoic acid export membrane protein
MTDQQDASYPKMPSIRPEEAAPAEVGPAPTTVTRAVQLMYASAMLGVIGIIAIFIDRDAIRQRLIDSGTVKTADIDTVVTATIVFSVVIGLVFTALWVWLALMVRKGRNWARIVTWIVAGLSVLSTIVALVNPTSTLSLVITVIGGLVSVAVIVLLALRPSNEFFKRPIR